VAYFIVLSWHSTGQTNEKENLSQHNQQHMKKKKKKKKRKKKEGRNERACIYRQQR
jgi:hypothetical protein